MFVARLKFVSLSSALSSSDGFNLVTNDLCVTVFVESVPTEIVKRYHLSCFCGNDISFTVLIAQNI